MNPTKIVTHPGPAHRDDFVACCIALAKFPEIHVIERREPTFVDLQDASVLVLDVGGSHEPERSNFDHHHFGRDEAPTCCLSLFLEAIGLYHQFKLMDWLESTEINDSKGRVALAQHLGCEPGAITRNLSPVEGAMTEMFSKYTELKVGGLMTDWFAGVMDELGHQMLNHAQDLHTQTEWLQSNAQLQHTIGGVPVIVIESDNTKGVQKFRDQHVAGAGVCISHDDRGEGWSLYRFNDDPRVDFSRLEGHQDVRFAHKNGFLAKTRERLPLNNVLELVAMAIS
jgi:hypothetical protein